MADQEEEVVAPTSAPPAISQAPVIVGAVQVPPTLLPQEVKLPKISNPKISKADLGLRSPRPRGRSPDLGMRSPEPVIRPEQIPEQGEVREKWVRE